MTERLLLIAGAGGSVIVDAVYDRPETRIAIAEAASAAGLAPLLVWLDADPERLRDRVRARARKDTASDADTAILDRQLDHDPGTIDWLRIDAARPVAEIVEELRSRLHAPKA
jgi:predicted kinase